MTAGAALPTGTVTFLRTDVEGSMRLARTADADWDDLNRVHLELVTAAVRRHGGVIVRIEGDAVFAVFAEAGAGVAAAVDAQRALQAHPWPPHAPVRVRMAVHTGEAHLAGADYGGTDVDRAARIGAVGHGGQILVSGPSAALVMDRLPLGTALRALGTHRLRDVPRPETLVQVDIGGLPSDFPPLRTATTADGNLPDPLTSFVGRETDLAAIADLLERARLVTLVGPGGIGKTRLAIEAVRRAAPAYPDGAWFVPLADVRDIRELDSAIAHGIGLYDGPERSAAVALLPYVGERSMVILLDNVEHLLGGADQVAQIVRASPRSRVVVTSRAPLHVSGEQEVPVRPLTDDGVRLFSERAGAVRPGWEPGAERVAVEEICRLVDHLPLGIELAAARVSALSPTLIRDRLAARLPLPGAAPRDAPERQRTLDGTVAWSHDLLDERRRRLLHDLAVFDDGFDIDQVGSVADPGDGSDRLDDVLELTDWNLLLSDGRGAGRARFRMLRTIGSFALDRLIAEGRETAIRRRHVDAYHALVSGAARRLGSSRHAEALDLIEPDLGNLRSALRWSIDSGAGARALDLVASLWRFWHAFGHLAEGRRLTEAALASPDAPTSGSARAWAAAAAGSIAYWQGDTEAARTWYDAQVALATAADDEACLVDALFNRSHVIDLTPGQEPAHIAYLHDVIRRYRDLGDELGAARASWGLGVLAMGAGRIAEARERFQYDLAAFERLDDPQYRAMTTSSLGWAAFAEGDIASATRYAIDGLLESHRMRDVGTTTISLHIGVLIAAMLGRWEVGAMVHGAYDALCERYGVRPPFGLELFYAAQDPFTATREALAEDDYAAAYARGRRLTLDEGVALVVELSQGVTGPA